MLRITTLKKGMAMTDTLIVSVLVLTLLNLGLVILALSRLNGLRKDLRTPVVKKFNQDFKRKPVDIPKAPENFGKNQRDDKQGRAGNQSFASKKAQNRMGQVRRPAARVPDVFSNEAPVPQASAPVPPRPVAVESMPAAEGRRPLPPRFNGAANTETDLALQAPAPVNNLANDDDNGMEFDRSKMAHGRRNVVAKPIIEDDAEGNA
jgi:hypothetical protein